MRLARGLRVETNEEEDADEELLDFEVDDEGDTQPRETIGWEEFIDEFDGRAIVLGDPGFGKTTLLWNRVATVCQQSIAALKNGAAIDSIELAFFLPAAKLESCESSDAKSIARQLSLQLEIAPELLDWLAEKISSGKCLLCFDAFDEVTDQRVVSKFLDDFTKGNPAAQLILTTRLTGFSNAPFQIRNENQLEILAFDQEQMRAVVETWFPDNETCVEKVWRLVSRDKRLTDVLRSPILLNLARRQIVDRLNQGQSLPNWKRRVELYAGFLSLALENLRTRTSVPIKEMESEIHSLL